MLAAASNLSIHSRPSGTKPCANMFQHLIDFEPEICAEDSASFTPLEDATPVQVIDAQHGTANWLASLGAPTVASTEAQNSVAMAQSAFVAVTAPSTPTETQKQRLLALKTPAAVQHLTGMLTAYDWEFVEQAKEIRGYTVAKIVEETKHPDARIRLRALELLGRVTEVALFTDRVEVKKTNVSDTELDAKIKEKLSRFMGVVDAQPVSDAVVLPQA